MLMKKNAVSFFVKLQNLISKEKVTIKNSTIKYTISISISIKDKKDIKVFDGNTL